MVPTKAILRKKKVVQTLEISNITVPSTTIMKKLVAKWFQPIVLANHQVRTLQTCLKILLPQEISNQNLLILTSMVFKRMRLKKTQEMVASTSLLEIT
jgi:hypothetical protein